MRKKESPIRTVPHEYTGNDSGYEPVNNKVLVLPDYIDETSEGGIVLTTDTVKQHELAITEGFFVNSGNYAFSEIGNSPFLPGDRVVWAMWAGQMLEGNDGKMYRLINDTDIVAVRR